MPPNRPARVLELDPAAAAFLDLLLDLGHLDDAMLNQVNDRLLDVDSGAPSAGAHPIDLAAVKRIAAGVIVDRLPETDGEYQRAFDREWPLLFG